MSALGVSFISISAEPDEVFQFYVRDDIFTIHIIYEMKLHVYHSFFVNMALDADMTLNL